MAARTVKFSELTAVMYRGWDWDCGKKLLSLGLLQEVTRVNQEAIHLSA